MKETSNLLESELLKLNKKINKTLLNKCIFQMKEIERINNEYKIENINSLSQEFFNIKGKFQDLENRLKLISLMNYANKLVFGYFARDTQLISLLFFINKPQNEGLIQQIMTGEGKSLIISFLAVFMNLVYKKKVDILTSSIVLAKEIAFYITIFINYLILKQIFVEKI